MWLCYSFGRIPTSSWISSTPVPYGMEERDLSLQLFEAGWQIYEAGNLRVFHDTDLKHHQSSEITSGIIANVGLYAFLHYPFIGWGLGLSPVRQQGRLLHSNGPNSRHLLRPFQHTGRLLS